MTDPEDPDRLQPSWTRAVWTRAPDNQQDAGALEPVLLVGLPPADADALRRHETPEDDPCLVPVAAAGDDGAPLVVVLRYPAGRTDPDPAGALWFCPLPVADLLGVAHGTRLLLDGTNPFGVVFVPDTTAVPFGGLFDPADPDVLLGPIRVDSGPATRQVWAVSTAAYRELAAQFPSVLTDIDEEHEHHRSGAHGRPDSENARPAVLFPDRSPDAVTAGQP